MYDEEFCFHNLPMKKIRLSVPPTMCMMQTDCNCKNQEEKNITTSQSPNDHDHKSMDAIQYIEVQNDYFDVSF
jgi:hypothetical protein